MRLEGFKASELHHVSNVCSGEPVLLGARDLHSNPLRKGNQWLPQVVIGLDQQTRVSQAKRSQVTQRLKHIHRVADFIEQDVIEFFARLEKLAELVFVWEGDCEFKG